jgi:glycosyltransferase involved in cell wall biosynthesis
MRIVLLATDEREPFRLYDRPAPQFHTAVAALLEGLAMIPGVEVHVISCVRQPVQTPERLAPNIHFHTVLVPKIGWMQTGFQGCIRATRKKIRALQPDIVHGQGTERDCALNAVFSGYPNVLTIHGNMRAIAGVNRVPAFSYNWLAARLERLALPRTAGVVCITSYTKRSVESLARKTWIVPNAVDPSFFDVRRALDFEGQAPSPQPSPPMGAREKKEDGDQISESGDQFRGETSQAGSRPPIGLCVGTVVKHKNQNDFIRALDPLASRLNFKMHFASEPFRGTYGNEFLQLVRERPWCEHIGHLNREQLKQRLAAAAFLALPTREDNCPMVVLEAMAAGVPVLASAIGGVPDLIEHEVTGLLCNPDQPDTFRAAVGRLLTDRPFAARLAAEAKAQAWNRFHLLVIARKHVEIYREVIAAGKS